MLSLSRIGARRDRRALSNLVAYVLLITITISLSVMVYGWLKFYVSGEGGVAACPDNVNVVIDDYDCDSSAGTLNVTLKNKGFFNIDGYVLRVHDRPGAEFGFYICNDTGVEVRPGESHSEVYSFASCDAGITDITIVDVQPFLLDGDKVSCEAYASQKVVCI